MTLYDTLGVSKLAPPEVIKAAYLALAKTYHPDKGGNAAKFRKIQEVYDVISDPAKRAEYDASITPKAPKAPKVPAVKSHYRQKYQDPGELVAERLGDFLQDTAADLAESFADALRRRK